MPATYGKGLSSFESKEARFPQLGINLNVLEPGQPMCLYHRENAQEDFLVLAGECVLIVEGEERPLRRWDFVHCPAGVDHVFVGAGEGPSLVLAVGARTGRRRSSIRPIRSRRRRRSTRPASTRRRRSPRTRTHGMTHAWRTYEPGWLSD